MTTRLKDAYAGDIPEGSLVYPSEVVRGGSSSGNYYLEDKLGFASEEEIFPAVVLPDSEKTFVRILTPSGVHVISKFSLVSYERSR